MTIGGQVRSTSSFDTLGRMNGYVETDASLTTIYERHSFVYNSRGQVLAEKAKQKQGTNWRFTHTTSYFNDTGATGITTFPGSLTASGNTGASTGTQLYYTQTKAWSSSSSGYAPAYNNPSQDTAGLIQIIPTCLAASRG